MGSRRGNNPLRGALRPDGPALRLLLRPKVAELQLAPADFGIGTHALGDVQGRDAKDRAAPKSYFTLEFFKSGLLLRLKWGRSCSLSGNLSEEFEFTSEFLVKGG